MAKETKETQKNNEKETTQKDTRESGSLGLLGKILMLSIVADAIEEMEAEKENYYQEVLRGAFPKEMSLEGILDAAFIKEIMMEKRKSKGVNQIFDEKQIEKLKKKYGKEFEKRMTECNAGGPDAQIAKAAEFTIQNGIHLAMVMGLDAFARRILEKNLRVTFDALLPRVKEIMDESKALEIIGKACADVVVKEASQARIVLDLNKKEQVDDEKKQAPDFTEIVNNFPIEGFGTLCVCCGNCINREKHKDIVKDKLAICEVDKKSGELLKENGIIKTREDMEKFAQKLNELLNGFKVKPCRC